jgi:potassium/hydrogen antiporter
MQDVAPLIAGVGVIVFLAHLFNGIFNRIRVPDVLFLIAVGIFVGPVTGLVPASILGQVGPIFATITLIIILFEYGISLELGSLRHSVKGAVKLALLTFLVTMAVVTGLVSWLTDLELLPALILGAIISSTSEAIVIPLVKQLKIQEKSQALLSIESTITAVLSIIITVTLIETYKIGEFQVFRMVGNLLASFFVAICLGIGGAFLWSIFLNKVRNLKNAMFTTAAFVFVLFGVVEILGFNGAIAALVFGITLGNLKSIHIPFFMKSLSVETNGLTEMEKIFFGEISFLLKAFFFVYLGMSLELIEWRLIMLAAVFTIIIFLVRLTTSKISLSRDIPSKDASFIAVMIPRGLTAIILASISYQQGIIGGGTIKHLTYGVVLFSIIFTSLLVLLVDKSRLSNFFRSFFSISLAKTTKNNNPH